MTVDPRSDRAIYRQVADILRAQIADGTLTSGQTLPSEKQLADTYGVGRDAVRQAIALLRSDGLATTQKGRGTQVRLPAKRDEVRLARSSRAIARMPDEAERHHMNLGEGTPVVVVTTSDGNERIYSAESIVLTADK